MGVDEQGRRIAGGPAEGAEASPADLAEQWRTVDDVDDEPRFSIHIEAPPEDALEQMRDVPLDDEDGRR
jgi:hypothetical protein